MKLFNKKHHSYRHVIRGACISLALLVGLPGSAVVFAEEEISNIARGGRLYDKWWTENGASKPEEAHPSYPADGKYAGQGGADWRCKECHGWDYMGKDGAYSSGSHFSGIAGIRGADGTDPAVWKP